jgi:hypothetical protein
MQHYITPTCGILSWQHAALHHANMQHYIMSTRGITSCRTLATPLVMTSGRGDSLLILVDSRWAQIQHDACQWQIHHDAYK